MGKAISNSFADSPKVSVIILTGGRVDYLKEAIKSAVNQTFQDFEILVIAKSDNEAVSNVQNICNSFKDCRVHVIGQQKRGIPDARNCGIKHAKGKYIAFLDEDDVFLPLKLERHVSILEKSNNEVVLTYAQHLGVDKKKWL